MAIRRRLRHRIVKLNTQVGQWKRYQSLGDRRTEISWRDICHKVQLTAISVDQPQRDL